jgi:hypothetical protein
MGAQLPARWPGGSKRLGESQIVPWNDWKALWPVSCSALILIQALLLYSPRSEVAPVHSCWQGGKEDQ